MYVHNIVGYFLIYQWKVLSVPIIFVTFPKRCIFLEEHTCRITCDNFYVHTEEWVTLHLPIIFNSHSRKLLFFYIRTIQEAIIFNMSGERGWVLATQKNVSVCKSIISKWHSLKTEFLRYFRSKLQLFQYTCGTRRDNF